MNTEMTQTPHINVEVNVPIDGLTLMGVIIFMVFAVACKLVLTNLTPPWR